MYGSHDMKHTVFCRLRVVNGTPRDLGLHNKGPKALLSLCETMTIYKGPKALLSLYETMTIYKGPKVL